MNGDNASDSLCTHTLGLAEAWRLSWTGQIDAALHRATALMAAATARRDDRARADCSLLIGECALHLGRLDDALDHARVATRLFSQLDAPASEARARALHAWVLLTCADMELALDEGLAALEIATRSGDAGARAFALDVTGMVYWLIEQPEKSLGFFEDAIALARQIGDEVQLGRYLINLGSAQARLGLQAQNSGDLAAFRQWTEAGIASEAAGLEISRAVGDLWSLRIALCNTAEHACRLDDYAAAMARLAEHDAIPGALDDRAAVHYQFTRGIVLAGLGRFDEAIAEFQASLSAEQNGDIEQAVTSMLHISKAYEAAGRFAEALGAYKKYHTLQVRLAEAQVQRRARYVALRSENEKLRALAAAEQSRAETLESANSHLAREADRLARVAHEDDLTKLSNRRHLEAAMFEILVSGERYAIAMIDVDSFKHINDTFSHAAGDEVLRRIGALIRGCCRERDLPVRYGGEEFAILMRGADQRDARKICDRVRQAIELHDWRVLLAGGGVTVSIGAASGSEASTPNNVLLLADRRLYRAKAEGRNRVVDGDWAVG